MKHLFILVLALTILASSMSSAESEKCMWRFKHSRHTPSIFYCESKGAKKIKKVKYYFGDLGCPKVEYKDIFCRADLSNDGTSCYNDRLSKENIECKKAKDKELAKVKSPVRMNNPTTAISVGGSK